MDKDKYFFCYNRNLSNFLRKEKEIRYITHAIHPKTKQDFYLFEYNDRLNRAIAEFKRLKEYYIHKNDID